MGGDENEDLGFQLRGVSSSSGVNTDPLYENVGGMTMSSMPMFKSLSVGDTTFFGAGWDPLVSLSEGGNFGGTPSMAMPHSEFANSTYPTSISHLAHYPSSEGNLAEMVPKLSRSQFNANMNSEGEQQMEISDESNELLKDQDERKQKSSANVRGKQTANDTSESGEAPKENYVHMRARRGQATNSHSLAERVRREKISERMRMLQELVPGCNKITGKAVMLDEIINYVQSLQQQVEFLSMKLATVNPEQSEDFEQVLSKDILHSRGGNTAVIGNGSGTNASYSYQHGILPTPIFHPMPQTAWENFLQMGYETNPAADNQGFNGLSKPNI